MQKTGPAGWLSSSGMPGRAPQMPMARPMPAPAPIPAPVPTPMPAPMPTPPVVEGKGCDSEMVLAMSYVEMQKMTETYEPETALTRGTIFPELDLPFIGEGACPRHE